VVVSMIPSASDVLVTVSRNDEFGFSDEEVVGVSLEEEVHRAEEDLEGARVACVTEREHNLRPHSMMQHLLTLTSMQDNRDIRLPPFFRSKKCYISTRTCGSSVSDYGSGFE
jgi:hypothetical protein